MLEFTKQTSIRDAADDPIAKQDAENLALAFGTFVVVFRDENASVQSKLLWAERLHSAQVNAGIHLYPLGILESLCAEWRRELQDETAQADR